MLDYFVCAFPDYFGLGLNGNYICNLSVIVLKKDIYDPTHQCVRHLSYIHMQFGLDHQAHRVLLIQIPDSALGSHINFIT